MSPSVRLSIEPDILNEPSRRLETLQPEGTVMIVGPSANSNTFGNLPDELVVEIFRKFLAPSSDSKSKWTAIRGVSRRTLSLVCKRWKEIVESVVCITVPEEATLALPDDSSGSQMLSQRMHACARFAGPLAVVVRCDNHRPVKDRFTENTLGVFRDFAQVLGGSHRASILLTLTSLPVHLFHFLMTSAGCEAFPRIVCLSLFRPIPCPFPLDGALANLKPPQIPILSRLVLDLGRLPRDASVQTEGWSWLFQPSICHRILSLELDVDANEVSWILSQMPNLVDAKISEFRREETPSEDDDSSTSTEAKNTQGGYLLSHQNLNRLSLGLQCGASAVACPKLTTLVTMDANDLSKAHQIAVGSSTLLSTFKVHYENARTMIPALEQFGASLTHLCITDMTEIGLAALADGFARSDFLPHVRVLKFNYRLSHEPESESEEFDIDVNLYEQLDPIAASLHKLVTRRQIETLDWQMDYPFSDYNCLLDFHRTLRRKTQANDPAVAATLYNPSAPIKRFRKLLDEGKPIALAKISKSWSRFVQSMGRIVDDSRTLSWAAGQNWAILAPILWSVVEELREAFLGTPYPLHEDFLADLKKQLDAVKDQKDWMISGAIDPRSSKRRWDFEGVFYGKQGDSTILYDLCREDRPFFTDTGDIVYTHDISTAFEEPSLSVLSRIGLPSSF